MALPVIPEDEADLTPYLQEGAESSLLLCGLLTIGQTELKRASVPDPKPKS